MSASPVSTLLCPHDGSSLVASGRAMRCARNHTFDIAKEGYVNLLPVQEKASKDPGDSKAMVAARRQFLETGAYAPIADAVAEHVLELVALGGRSNSLSILDAGCGEGYYLQRLAETLDARAEAVALAGIDISKWAVRSAAKRGLPVTWAVASNRRPPFAGGSIELVLCLFGFPVWPGFAAVQNVGGHVLTVDPGPDHLVEMRRIIYPQINESAVKPLTPTAGYVQAVERRMRASAHVTSQAAIADLLAMTPHDHRASAEGRVALAERTQLDVTIDVLLRVFRREAT